MPKFPIDVIRRVPRLSRQSWLVDFAIHQPGPDCDQGRTNDMAAVRGHDSRRVFAGLRASIKTDNDIWPPGNQPGPGRLKRWRMAHRSLTVIP